MFVASAISAVLRNHQLPMSNTLVGGHLPGMEGSRRKCQTALKSSEKNECIVVKDSYSPGSEGAPNEGQLMFVIR